MSETLAILNDFNPIGLTEMDRVNLLNRTDIKFIFNYDRLFMILKNLTDNYKILKINNDPLQHYHTLYFDTQNFLLYKSHHNGKLNRYKVRYRKYLNSDRCFLEIKFKNNKSRTVKIRVRKRKMDPVLSESSKKFIAENTSINPNELVPKLSNKFTRLTLVHNQAQERVTIDYNLKYSNEEKYEDLPNLVIAEVKHDKYNSHSDFIQLMRQIHIKPFRISKYCIGSISLFKDLKYNRFKEKLLTINKISHGTNY